MNTPHSAFADTSFVFFLGPTCVGKGFIGKLADISLAPCILAGLRVGKISFGEIIRGLLKTDPDFQARNQETVRNGDLLPDDEAIALFDRKLVELASEGPFDLILVDGFCRTALQVEHAQKHGYLRDKDRVFVIEASFDACSRRFTHRNQKDPTRLEREMKTFIKRYHLHADGIEHLEVKLQECGAEVIEIDAEESIPESAFPALIGHLILKITHIVADKVATEAQNRR